jgi:hypothetical protein
MGRVDDRSVSRDPAARSAARMMSGSGLDRSTSSDDAAALMRSAIQARACASLLSMNVPSMSRRIVSRELERGGMRTRGSRVMPRGRLTGGGGAPTFRAPLPPRMTLPAASSPAITPTVRRLEWGMGVLWLAAVVVATLQQGMARQNNNFRIFRAASLHLLHGQDLYTAYPALHFDFYKYSPTFALLFLPFAVLPFALSMLAWNALNAGALYAALGAVLTRRAALAARAIVFLDMLGSLQNVQSNALVTALIVVAFAGYERRHALTASFAVAIGMGIKVFPLAAASFVIFHPRRVRVSAALVVSVLALLALPLVVTSPALLGAQYQSWRAIESVDALERGYSVMAMLQIALRGDWPNWPIQLAGVIALVAPVLMRRDRWSQWGFRRLYLCSVLVFCVIFNHQSESPTFVIGVTGVAIWFASLPVRGRWAWATFWLVAVGTILASSDAMPVMVQREFFDPYRAKTVPLIVVWVILQVQLWKPRLPAAGPTRSLRSTGS